jgi:hypothetical protein
MHESGTGKVMEGSSCDLFPVIFRNLHGAPEEKSEKRVFGQAVTHAKFVLGNSEIRIKIGTLYVSFIV